MASFLEKNLKIIEEKHEEIEINRDIVRKIENCDVVERIDSYNGYMLHSRVDQKQAIANWCDQFEELKYNTVVAVFGMGDFDYFVELSKRYPEVDVIVYEPYEYNFYNNLACDDYEKFLSGSHTFFCVGKNIHLILVSLLHEKMGYDSAKTPFFASIPNYVKMFAEEYEQYEQAVIDNFRSNEISRNTEIALEDSRIDNYLDNLKVVPEETSVIELVEALRAIPNIKDYPAIILSAGPSLDKNIDDIKDIKGRALLVCTDAALNTAIKHGVRPDIVVSVDPELTTEFFRSEEGRDLPLLVHVMGTTAIRDVNKGRKFYVSDRDYYLAKVLSECNKCISPLSTGGSVANTAFSLAKQAGCVNIILMGQDLGFPGNKVHAQDTFLDEDDIDENDNSYFYTESIDGGQILTSTDMENYRKWFEQMVRIYPELNVIDATEGGALIKGTEIITITEAIDKYCPDERIDFEGIINTCEYLLNEEERIVINNIINKTFDDIDNSIEYLEKAKRDYAKLEKLNQKRKYNTKEFRSIIDKIGKHNKRFEEDKDFELYKRYCTEVYYRSLEALKKVHDEEYEDIKIVASQGQMMIDEYIKAAKKLKNKWREVNDRYSGKLP